MEQLLGNIDSVSCEFQSSEIILSKAINLFDSTKTQLINLRSNENIYLFITKQNFVF